jgi:hypothetical protein
MLLKTAGPAVLALPGMCRLQHFPPMPFIFFLKHRLEISLSFIITQVCSVLSWSEVKAIFLETPLYFWSKVKVRVITTQEIHLLSFPCSRQLKVLHSHSSLLCKL